MANNCSEVSSIIYIISYHHLSLSITHKQLETQHRCSAVDKLKFMDRPPDHPWWKTGSSKSFLECPNHFDLSLKEICFLVINTKFACFPLNHVPTYWELGRPSSNFGVMLDHPTALWVAIGDRLSIALQVHTQQCYVTTDVLVLKAPGNPYPYYWLNNQCMGLISYKNISYSKQN